MREIKFRAWDKELKKLGEVYGFDKYKVFASFDRDTDEDAMYELPRNNDVVLMQYTGLKDKNGMGLTEVYEGDIIDENGIIKGSIYEMDKRETDIVIPQLGTKAWESAYKEAVVRGFNYSE